MNAAERAEVAFAGRASSLTAKSCKFHSQLVSARGSARRSLSGSAVASILIAALTRCRRASYRRDSNKFRTGTPIVRNRRAMGGRSSEARFSERRNVSRSRSRSGSRTSKRGSAGSSARLANAASTSRVQRSCAIRRCAKARMCSNCGSSGGFSSPDKMLSSPA